MGNRLINCVRTHNMQPLAQPFSLRPDIDEFTKIETYTNSR